MKTFASILLLSAISVAFANEGVTEQALKYSGPTCIAEFCFYKELMKEEELVEGYGFGYSEGGKFSFHCYEDQKQKVFLHFRVHHGQLRELISIFVSDVPNCVKFSQSKRPFSKLETREGLKVGDSAQKVIDIYGKPSSVVKGNGLEKIGLDFQEALNSAPFGNTVFIYGGPSNQLLQGSIYIRNDKVSAIMISVSE